MEFVTLAMGRRHKQIWRCGPPLRLVARGAGFAGRVRASSAVSVLWSDAGGLAVLALLQNSRGQCGRGRFSAAVSRKFNRQLIIGPRVAAAAQGRRRVLSFIIRYRDGYPQPDDL